jgi:sn-glycerol 3-phosphate transport system ATP-binding protein
MTVFKNMAYGLKIRRMPKAEIEKRVQRAAEILELTEFLDRKPRQLSGGQRQRVAMGRCIVREPKVFLFDEPLSNLDAKLRVQMRQELRNLHETLGITSVYVTHDQVEAMTLGDRLIVMDNGYVEQIGSPLDVYEKPASHFVAGFIGSPAMNFFEARTSRDGQSVELFGTESLPIQPSLDPSFRDKAVVLGIRPEHFNLAEEGSGMMHMRVEHVETLGADTLVHGKSGENNTFFTLRLPDIHRYQKGSSLSLSVSPQKLHLFDKESGKRIGA